MFNINVNKSMSKTLYKLGLVLIGIAIFIAIILYWHYIPMSKLEKENTTNIQVIDNIKKQTEDAKTQALIFENKWLNIKDSKESKKEPNEDTKKEPVEFVVGEYVITL